MPLSEKLVLVNRREKAGSVGSNRYDFQKDWTIGKILELHTNNSDYCVICDYHEDVVLLDSEDNPTATNLVQIKTSKNKVWTPESLVTSKKSKEGDLLGSILGKLYSTANSFSEYKTEVRVVSNAPFKFSLSNGKSSLALKLINIKDIDTTDLDKLRGAIKTECSIDDCDQCFPCCFEVTDLSLDSHSTHTKGKVLEFLDSQNMANANAAALYRVLFDTVKNKTNYEADIASFGELKAKKGIGISYLSKILKDISSSVSSEELWGTLSSVLLSEGVTAIKLAKIRQAWDVYDVDKMNPLNEPIFETRKVVNACVKVILEEHEDTKMLEIAKMIRPKIDQKFQYQFTDDYILVMAFRAMYES